MRLQSICGRNLIKSTSCNHWIDIDINEKNDHIELAYDIFYSTLGKELRI